MVASSCPLLINRRIRHPSLLLLSSQFLPCTPNTIIRSSSSYQPDVYKINDTNTTTTMKPETIVQALGAVPHDSAHYRCPSPNSPSHNPSVAAASLAPHDLPSFSPSRASSTYDTSLLRSDWTQPSDAYDVSSCISHGAAPKAHPIIVTPTVFVASSFSAQVETASQNDDLSDSERPFYDSVPYQQPKLSTNDDQIKSPDSVSSPTVSFASAESGNTGNTQVPTSSFFSTAPPAPAESADTSQTSGLGLVGKVPEGVPKAMPESLGELDELLRQISSENARTIDPDTAAPLPPSSYSPSTTSYQSDVSHGLASTAVTSVIPGISATQPDTTPSTNGRTGFGGWVDSAMPYARTLLRHARSHAEEWGAKTASAASEWRSKAVAAIPEWVPGVDTSAWTSRLPSRSVIKDTARSTVGGCKSMYNSGVSRANSRFTSVMSKLRSQALDYTETWGRKIPSMPRWGRSRATASVFVPPSTVISAVPSATATVQSTRPSIGGTMKSFLSRPFTAFGRFKNERTSAGVTSKGSTYQPVSDMVPLPTLSFGSNFLKSVKSVLKSVDTIASAAQTGGHFDDFLKAMKT